MPLDDNSPRLGFRPTMAFNAAGTQPEPAVSVPSEKATAPMPHRDRKPRAGPAGHEARFQSITRGAIV